MAFNQYPYININDLNLDWIIGHFKEFLLSIDELNRWKVEHEREYEELLQMYNAIISGHFPPEMYESLRTWFIANSVSIFGELAKMVIFNIDDDGYFVAYIPDSWNEIIFNTTGLDVTIPGEEYGRLVLLYNV